MEKTSVDIHALADEIGVSFVDLIFFIRGMRESTGLSFDKVVAWVEAQPAQCKSICEQVRAMDDDTTRRQAAELDAKIARERTGN